jgi:uncharacterized repeat protein (TIGR01451 family)
MVRSVRLRTRASVAASGLLLAALSLPVLPTTSVAAATSTLTKSAPAGPADHGGTVPWVIDYAGTATEVGPASVTDPIAGAGSAQTYQAGSFVAPPGWQRLWSTDGTTFGTTDPGAAAVAVRADNPALAPGGRGVTGAFTPPLTPINTATGGDGFTPVLYRTANGGVQAWNIFHHTNPISSRRLVCTNLLSNAPCDGGPWPRPMNTTPGPLGSGNTADIATTRAADYVLDGSRMYYPGLTASSVGVGCVDLEAQANCGYVALQPTGPAGPGLGNVNGVGGMELLGGNLYGVSSTGQILCLVLAGLTPCAGQPYAPVVGLNQNVPGGFPGEYVGALTVVAGKLFVTSSSAGSSTAPAPATMGCFDPAIGTACAGWAAPKQVSPAAGNLTDNIYPYVDAAGARVGACTTATNGVAQVSCFDVAGAPLAVPPGLASLFNTTANIVFNPATIVAPDGSTRAYFPEWGGSIAGRTTCYDWTHQQICVGFPNPTTHPTVNGGATRDYGYAYDQNTECLVGLGDAGFLFTLDPETGPSPCQRSGAGVTLTPGAFYCDGQGGHGAAYRDARLVGIDTANVDLTRSRVVIGDAGGVISTGPVPAGGTVDLSGISAAAHPSITVDVRLVLNNGNDFGGGRQPRLVAAFDGDAPQFCLRTTVAAACSVGQVSDTASGTDATGAFTSNTVTVPVATGQSCTPRITVNKEVCVGHQASDCGPVGQGPWAKRAGIGLLGTAFWRVSVSNTGPVDVAGITVTDQVAPSCVAAAGTFALTTGQTARFYCSTGPILLPLLPLTNTASASYVVPNSPPGTPRTSTAPSSAQVVFDPLCPFLCILT